MWQDPTDVTKRKPRRLRGTPANRVTGLITFGVIATFSSFLLWYTHSEAEWIQRNKKRVLARIAPKETEGIRREMFMDTAFASVVSRVNERQIERDFAKIQEEANEK